MRMRFQGCLLAIFNTKIILNLIWWPLLHNYKGVALRLSVDNDDDIHDSSECVYKRVWCEKKAPHSDSNRYGFFSNEFAWRKRNSVKKAKLNSQHFCKNICSSELLVWIRYTETFRWIIVKWYGSLWYWHRNATYSFSLPFRLTLAALKSCLIRLRTR